MRSGSNVHWFLTKGTESVCRPFSWLSCLENFLLQQHNFLAFPTKPIGSILKLYANAGIYLDIDAVRKQCANDNSPAAHRGLTTLMKLLQNILYTREKSLIYFYLHPCYDAKMKKYTCKGPSIIVDTFLYDNSYHNSLTPSPLSLKIWWDKLMSPKKWNMHMITFHEDDVFNYGRPLHPIHRPPGSHSKQYSLRGGP